MAEFDATGWPAGRQWSRRRFLRMKAGRKLLEIGYTTAPVWMTHFCGLWRCRTTVFMIQRR
jgi:hypothetical protein